MSKKPHVIYVSGSLVYGDCGEEIVDEDSAIRPTGFSKQYILAERPWMRERESGKISVSLIRPPWIAGQESWFKTFYIDPMIRQFHIPVYGKGDNWMSLIDVEDCAGLVQLAISESSPGMVYNIFNPRCHLRQAEFVSGIKSITGFPQRTYHKREIVDRYDRATWESLSFSLRMSTIHKRFLESYPFKYPELNDILLNNIPKELWKRRL